MERIGQNFSSIYRQILFQKQLFTIVRVGIKLFISIYFEKKNGNEAFINTIEIKIKMNSSIE